MRLVGNPINIVDASDPIDFPIYLMTEAVELPKTGQYYIWCEDGLWFNMDNGLVHAWVKVDSFPLLQKVQPHIGVRLPRIPIQMTFQALAFFRGVFHKHHTESILVLVYSEKKDAFGWICPKQVCGPSTVKYDRADINVQPRANSTDDLAIAGTWHSHCNFSAFSSGTDKGDEKWGDGLHVTMGNVDRNEFTLHARIVVGKREVEVDPVEFLDRVKQVKHAEQGWSNLWSPQGRDKRYYLDLKKPEWKACSRTYDKTIQGWFGKVERNHVVGFGAGCNSWNGSFPSLPPVQRAMAPRSVDNHITQDFDLYHEGYERIFGQTPDGEIYIGGCVKAPEPVGDPFSTVDEDASLLEATIRAAASGQEEVQHAANPQRDQGHEAHRDWPHGLDANTGDSEK